MRKTDARGLAFLLTSVGLVGTVLVTNSGKVEPDMKTFGSLKAPVYSSSVVPANMCSRYARLAAKDLFEIEYPSADAWDIRDDPSVSEISLNDFDSLRKIADDGSLKPGMIVGFYNPSSKYNQVAKEDGAGYTHVMLYLGKNCDEPVFADKFGKETRILPLEKLVRTNLVPREVMYTSKN